MGQAGPVARTSYILLATLEIKKKQMLFLVVSRANIMLSLGKKNKIVI